MSRFIFGGLLLAAGILGAHAAPCPIATLADYVALGTTGCTIGPSPTFTFSDFQFSSRGNGPLLTAGQIGVTPETSEPGALPALGTAFSSDGFQVTSGQVAEYFISYLIDPPPPEIIRFDMDFFDPTTGPAFSQITAALCIDLGCLRSGSVSIFENLPSSTGPLTRLSDSFPIQPFTVSIQVTNHIILDAREGGSANFAGFQNRVGIDDTSPMPEPASFGIIGAGLLGLGLGRARAKFREIFLKARHVVS